MDVAIDAAGRHDQVFAGDHLGGGAHHQLGVDSCHGVRIARLADLDDAAIRDADIALDDAPVVDDQRIGDDQIERAFGACRAGRLAHAIADDFASAERDFVAIGREVLFHLDDQFRIGQADTVAGGGAVKIGVNAPRDLQTHWLPLP